MASSQPAGAARMYYTTIIDNGCEEISYIPWTQNLISFAFTFTFFIVFQRAVPGNGTLALLVTLPIWLWYSLAIIVAVYHDYVFYDKRPDWDNYARCLLNHEFNDHLTIKIGIVTILTQKLVACFIRKESRALVIVIRKLFQLILLFSFPVLAGRLIPFLAATIGYCYPYLYFFIIGGIGIKCQTAISQNPGYLFITASELMITGNEEEKDAAALIMSAVEGALVSAGEDVPSDPVPHHITSEPAAEGEVVKNQVARIKPRLEEPPVADKHAKLNFFAEYFDRNVFLLKIGFILFCYLNAYFMIIAYDYKYNTNEVSYGEAFTAFDTFRPTAQTLYDKRDKLTTAQQVYIAATFC